MPPAGVMLAGAKPEDQQLAVELPNFWWKTLHWRMDASPDNFRRFHPVSRRPIALTVIPSPRADPSNGYKDFRPIYKRRPAS
jgi:hypothetical protein